MPRFDQYSERSPLKMEIWGTPTFEHYSTEQRSFGILMTESTESLLALWGVLRIWDAVVHGSITCWNGFSTSRDNPSFDAYSLGHISVLHTHSDHSRLCNAYFFFPECFSALADIITLIWLKWDFSFMNFSLA